MVDKFDELLKKTIDQSEPEAPPSITWEDEQGVQQLKSVVVKVITQPDYEDNDFETVELLKSTHEMDKDLIGERVMLWTSPASLNRGLQENNVNADDIIGIQYHGQKITSKKFKVKIFSISNFGKIPT